VQIIVELNYGGAATATGCARFSGKEDPTKVLTALLLCPRAIWPKNVVPPRGLGREMHDPAEAMHRVSKPLSHLCDTYGGTPMCRMPRLKKRSATIIDLGPHGASASIWKRTMPIY